MFLAAWGWDSLLRTALSILVTAALAWQDHRTSFMDEKLLYSFLIGGLLWDILFLPFSSLWPPALVAVLIAAVGYVSYRAGQFGGGDVLLLAGLALWLPTSPFVRVPVFWPFVLSVFLAASLLASVGSALWYANLLRDEKKFPGKKGHWFVLGFFVVLLASMALAFGLWAKALVVLLGIPSVFYLIYRQDVADFAVIVPQKTSQILDEDVLALEKIPLKDAQRFGLERVLTPPALKKLKKYVAAKKRKTVPIYRNLPRFGPYLLAGLLFSLLLGDVVWALVAG